MSLTKLYSQETRHSVNGHVLVTEQTYACSYRTLCSSGVEALRAEDARNTMVADDLCGTRGLEIGYAYSAVVLTRVCSPRCCLPSHTPLHETMCGIENARRGSRVSHESVRAELLPHAARWQRPAYTVRLGRAGAMGLLGDGAPRTVD